MVLCLRGFSTTIYGGKYTTINTIEPKYNKILTELGERKDNNDTIYVSVGILEIQ